MAAVYMFIALCIAAFQVISTIPCVSGASPNTAPLSSADAPDLAIDPYVPYPDEDFGSADPPSPSPLPLPEGVFDVTQYGAIPDEQMENSEAFLAAWDAACGHPGNSIFYIPARKFLVGPISFEGPCHNNQSPVVKIIGTLVAPDSLDSFPESNWIEFRNLAGFNLTGGGKVPNLDGQGAAEAWRQTSCSKSSRCDKLITSLKFSDISYGSISNFIVTNSKAFHVGFHDCNNIDVQNVTIVSPGHSPNTDGIHVSHSNNISITASTIAVGDDCISIGPGSFNISISNIKCGPGHGISVGSLGKYRNEQDVYGIYVKNCTITGTQNGVRIKTWPGSYASNAYDMTFEDITMTNVANPIIIDQEYCPSGSCDQSKHSHVKLRNIHLKNIVGTYNSPSAVALLCSLSVPCEKISIVGVNLTQIRPDNSLREGRLIVNGVVNGLEVLSSTF